MPVIHRDTDYALRALAQLARTGEVMSVSALAEAEHVPQDFLRKIMQKLQGAHLVQSTQGPLGGYSLRREPQAIALLEVVDAVQGPIVLNACFEDPGICRNVKVCAFRHWLVSLQEEFNSWLSGITLSDVLQTVPGGDQRCEAEGTAALARTAGRSARTTSSKSPAKGAARRSSSGQTNC